MTEAVSNVVWNLSEPFTGKATGQLQGTLQHIVTEVAVSKTLRWLLGWEKRGFIELAMVHTISQPFLGALFFGEQIKPLSGAPGNVDSIFDGAKQTPAVLIAAYIIKTGQKGLHLPWFTLRDLGVTVASKMASRLIENNIYSSLTAGVQQATNAHDSMIAIQRRASRFVGE